MPDLSELLQTEARRQEPTSQPPFEDLLRTRRRRDLRGRAAAGAALVAVVVGAVLVPTLLDAQRPPTKTVVASRQTATVTGVLRLTGGPVGAGQAGISGTVVFESTTGRRTTATARSDGTFAVTLEPGTYTVTGASPQYLDGRGGCTSAAPVTVSPAGLADIVVACPERSPAAGGRSGPAAGVKARIAVSATTVKSGERVLAQITVTNDSGEDLHIIGCGPIFQVTLGTGVSWDACAIPVTVPQGESTYKVDIAATYSECSPGKASQGMPACPPNGSMPGLPPGRYAARTVGVSDLLPVPAPVTVTVTP